MNATQGISEREQLLSCLKHGHYDSSQCINFFHVLFIVHLKLLVVFMLLSHT